MGNRVKGGRREREREAVEDGKREVFLQKDKTKGGQRGQTGLATLARTNKRNV